jgi:predicted Zn-dependent protease
LTNRARQWSRTAWALAVLFGSLPLASKLFVGVWGFDGAAQLALICALLGIYLHLLSRRRSALRDTASILEQALRLAREGQTEHAILLLTEAIRVSPHVWQAFQYRGELRLLRNDPHAALQDFTEAVRLAPDERHLQILRQHAQRLLADPQAAQDSRIES